ncbi:TIGR03086 family metal-binding protein [Streptomyces marispadix]|uniref:TIGR03086 family metal-binding protein n=1 Tax=Streptomyces marispadix TaxID=2922868 RepID=A0ABS9SUN5_9ACTN|nr:TIGR03086 family metal-binding protein [Streptomyces marispadix]MCH6159997.1 TIGR03086 family metal-binding protein [Streptomyces marispadix]
MNDYANGIGGRFLRACAEFETRLRTVRESQWGLPTPCAEWEVRTLVNHMARGNLNYAALALGCTSAQFLRLRDADALGADPLGAYLRSVEECAAAFARPGVLESVLDYPPGPVSGRQALAVRTADSVVHTWDLARAVGADETLDAALVAWTGAHLDDIYAGLAVAPADRESSAPARRFFAVPEGEPLPDTASRQQRLLRWMGRRP